MGIVIVRISLLPFVCLEQFVWSSTLLHQYGGVSGAIGRNVVGIGISADVAGKVAAAVDVMRI